MEVKKKVPIFVLISIGLFSSLVLVFALILKIGRNGTDKPRGSEKQFSGVAKFRSDEEFEQYIASGQQKMESGRGAVSFGELAPMRLESQQDATITQPARASETNVQVAGIDEPDIIKTDGESIFYSFESYNIFRPMPLLEPQIDVESRMVPPYQPQGETKIIRAFPVEQLDETSNVDAQGTLLLMGKNMVVFENQRLIGFDVSDKANPRQTWKHDIGDNTQIIDSRAYGGKIYLATNTYVYGDSACPIVPLVGMEIACTSIYRPNNQIPADSTMTVVVIEPNTGEVEKTVSFVGQASQSVFYMSEANIYITFSFTLDTSEILFNFLRDDARELVDGSTYTKLERLNGYDISSQAKQVEVEVIMNEFYASLDKNERLRVENEINDKLAGYLEEHARDVDRTGIVKISSQKLEVVANGEIAGKPLNQFALDEYQGNLRVATTVGNIFVYRASGRSYSDVYVLDEGLSVTGKIEGLGLDERIYSARFVGERGYLVTFKQIDPFFVLDMKDARNPKVAGELKIPGFSSYLHPISDNLILGVGRENLGVKLSLFDVANPGSPVEVDKYNMEESWSDIQNTHRAFLMDRDHGVFFIPGSRGGYVFSYEGGELELKTAVDNPSTKRAVYINDYLYIVGENQIVVMDENSWETVKTLEF